MSEHSPDWPLETALPEFLALDAYGDILLKGHRVTLFNVLDLYQDGANASEIGEEFPTLDRSLIEQTLECFLANKSAMEDFLDRYRAVLEHNRAMNQGGPDLAELKRRAAERRRVGAP